jgi:hypothetical protein
VVRQFNEHVNLQSNSRVFVIVRDFHNYRIMEAINQAVFYRFEIHQDLEDAEARQFSRHRPF